MAREHILFPLFTNMDAEKRPRFTRISLPKAAKNPGPQPDIAMTQIHKGESIKSLTDANDISFDLDLYGYDSLLSRSSSNCQLNLIKRCPAAYQKMGNTIIDAFSNIGIQIIKNGPSDRYYKLNIIGDTGHYMLSADQYSVEIDGDFNPVEFLIFGHAGGAMDIGEVQHVVPVPFDDSAYYMSIGGGNRYLEKGGFVVKWHKGASSPNWLSPLQTSSTSFALIGERIYSGFGFSGKPDYIYALSTENGKVTGRTKIDTAAHMIIQSDELILIEKYQGAAAYRLN